MADCLLVPKCRLAVFRKMHTNKINIYIFEGMSFMQETLPGDMDEDFFFN